MTTTTRGLQSAGISTLDNAGDDASNAFDDLKLWEK